MVLLILIDGEILASGVVQDIPYVGEHDFFFVAEMLRQFILVCREKAPDDHLGAFVAGSKHPLQAGSQILQGDVHVIGMAALQVGQDVPQVGRPQGVGRRHVTIEGVNLADKQEGLRVYPVLATGFFNGIVAETEMQAHPGEYAKEMVVEVEQFGQLHRAGQDPCVGVILECVHSAKIIN